MNDAPAIAAVDDLLQLLRAPEQMATLDLRRWDGVLIMARGTGLLGRLAEAAREQNLINAVPAEVRPHLEAASILAQRHRRVVDWELVCIDQALAKLAAPVVLLKGAAYHALGLPIASGRHYSDIDILVPHAQLAAAEQLLRAGGWQVAEIDPLDERYFRTWMHEIPPMVHPRRRTVLDLHHTILPRTDRLQLDPQLLLDAALPVPGTRKLHVLPPTDLVLHSAAHLFRNGDFSTVIRDLADLDGLLRTATADDVFWPQLLMRAEQLDLRLPCYCGLRYAQQVHQTPIPESVLNTVIAWKPKFPSVSQLDRLVRHTVYPRYLDRPDPRRERGLSLLAHWPTPRVRTMFTGVFWTKRLPKVLEKWKNYRAERP